MSTTTRPDCVVTRFKEYPDIIFPTELQDLGFDDNSWHNDAAAMARRPLDGHDYCSVIVFCDYEKPAERECGGKQFSVCMEIDGSLEQLDAAETDNIAEVPALVLRAQEQLEIWIKTNGCECPPKEDPHGR
jgi:hypothetical protein